MSDDPTVLPSASNASTNNPKVEDGKLVQRRAISTAQQAQQIADRLVLDDVGRDIRRAEVQRAINGAAPFSEKTLKEKNQGHRFNVSVGYLEGACGRAYTPYLDMGLDEEFVAKIQADLEETKKNIIRAEFVNAVRRWGMWPSNYNGLVREAVDFGYCVAIFPDPDSPWWHFARQRDALTMSRSRNISQKLDVFVWKRSYLICELYDHISDEEAAKTAGWNIENCFSAMENAAPDDYTKNRLMGGRQIFEEAIRAAALALSIGQGAKVIETYHVYCKELSGKVSQWIVLNTSGQLKAPENPPAPSIQLFYQFEQFPSMEDVVTRFDLEYGDGFWHGAKGLGQKLYGVHKAHDRLMCSGLDQTFRGGLGVLKSSSQKSHESINLQVTSDFVVLSPDYEATPGVKMPTLDPTFFSMDAALLASAVQRGGDVAPEAMGVERTQKTATQSSYDQAQKQIITKANLKRWVPSLSRVIDTMLKRLLNAQSGNPDSIKFIASLQSKGITPEDIQKIKTVEVFHSVEDVFGETKQNISFISDKYRGDPDISRLDLKKREIGVWLGPSASLELVPGDADELNQMKASRLQTMEISAILDGNSVPVAPDDLHTVHAQTVANYFKAVAGWLTQNQVEGKEIPDKQDVVNLNAHAQEHIQAQAQVKGQREIARQLEQMMEEAGQILAQAFMQKEEMEKKALLLGVHAGMTSGPQLQDGQVPGGDLVPQKPGAPQKVLESISFKDLPPEGKVQVAKQAGIDLDPNGRVNENPDAAKSVSGPKDKQGTMSA